MKVYIAEIVKKVLVTTRKKILVSLMLFVYVFKWNHLDLLIGTREQPVPITNYTTIPLCGRSKNQSCGVAF